MGGFAVDSTVNFSGDSALPANRDHEWQGYLDAPTTGLYTISLQRKPPSPAGKVNSDYGVAFDTATLSINGSEDGIGYRLLGDGGIRYGSNQAFLYGNFRLTLSTGLGVTRSRRETAGTISKPPFT